MKNVLRALAGMAILALGVFAMNGLIGMKTLPPVKPSPAVVPSVMVQRVQPDTLVPTVDIEGRVRSLNRMTVLSEVSGMVPVGGKEFRDGVRFAKGEVMLQLDGSESEANLVAQRSQWLQVLAGSLADLQLDFPERAATWEAYVKGLDVKQKVAPLPVAETDRERLYLNGKGIVSGYHAIRSAEARLDKFEVRAPFAGAITGASVEPGSMVRAAQPLGTLVGTSAFEIKSAVHARHLGRLAVGNAVSFVQEDGRPVAVGTVVRISGTVDVATQSASVFSQVMALEDEVLRDGRYLSGVVSLSPVFNAVRLNAELVQEIGEASVLILEGQRLSRQPVTVLHWDGDEAIVAGLEPDTPLLAAPVSGTHEGMLVNVIQE